MISVVFALLSAYVVSGLYEDVFASRAVNAKCAMDCDYYPATQGYDEVQDACYTACAGRRNLINASRAVNAKCAFECDHYPATLGYSEEADACYTECAGRRNILTKASRAVNAKCAFNCDHYPATQGYSEEADACYTACASRSMSRRQRQFEAQRYVRQW